MKEKKSQEIEKTSYGGWGRRDQLIFATFLQSLSVFLTMAIYSYIQRIPEVISLLGLDIVVTASKNIMGSIGGHVAHYLVNDLCGINALLLPLIPFLTSIKLFWPKRKMRLMKTVGLLTLFTTWLGFAMAYGHYAYGSEASIWYMYPGVTCLRTIIHMGDLLGGGVVLLLAAVMISMVITIVFDIFPWLKNIGERISKKSHDVAYAQEEEIVTDNMRVQKSMVHKSFDISSIPETKATALPVNE